MDVLGKTKLVLMAVALTALASCGSRFSDYCEAQAQCVGGNDADIDACIASSEGEADVAAAYDCSDAFDRVVDCLDTARCEDGDFDVNCGDEIKAYGSCADAASAR
jgi:hypothetical protein